MNTHIHQKRRIMITGGHVTPAIATIQEIRSLHPDWDIVFVGRRTAFEGEQTLSEEYRLISAMHIPFFPITAGRLKREGGIAAAVALCKVPVGFIQALVHLIRHRPDIIVSFGGYVALPVVVAGWLLRVGVVTHEQTRKPGIANQMISALAKRTCVSFPDTKGLSGHVVYTGLPMRGSVFHPPKEPSFPLPEGKRPILLIVGGSTGAASVNAVVYDALPALLKTYTVIHQVGRISLARATDVKHALIRDADQYVVLPYISESDYSWALRHATMVLGRSGANTVFEIAATGKVALFIPLPWAANNEQYYNALYLQQAGSASILNQNKLSPDALCTHIQEIMDSLEKREQAAKTFAISVPHDGAARLVRVIGESIPA